MSSGDIQSNGIAIQGLGLTFPNGWVGLKPSDLHIAGGSFCTLLGPSGSGKTTLLRTIAGLITPTSGRVFIGTRDVTRVSVQERNIGFVFQSYALFPTMSVAENIEYPLRVHKWSATDRTARVKEILDLIELPAFAGRAVGELSGGQQQRVAIGRAIAYRPSLLLLDEPMGALDRRLRQQLGADLRDIQQRTGITAVYVTHDQEEAFILSDRIAIMNHGEILQYATPDELYFHPTSRFVAEFLGEANLIDVVELRSCEKGALVAITSYGAVPLPAGMTVPGGSGERVLIVRPEDVELVTAPDRSDIPTPGIPVTIDNVRFLGSRSLVTVSTADGKRLRVECSKWRPPNADTTAYLTWQPSAVALADR
ncbi:ABC transporter ATP-binding protein [Ancylobacter sp. 6x-1]|uniref:ABC transporter ATP-binding protein n=1 Tax=Ancylobacter crimeensis TaxID=2579147 RepID=A0ABT0DDU3_9HYPH|nr:ABC transporter ATP-binding protein [Ancylobacter crimeensis]MCK0198132.1 ABC transporter ATP-binding protein [Ancylobacter crimeensis]